MEYFLVGKILEDEMGLSNDTVQVVYEFIGPHWYFEEDDEIEDLYKIKEHHNVVMSEIRRMTQMFTIHYGIPDENENEN